LFSELGHKAANTFKIAENRRAAGSSFPIWENTNDIRITQGRLNRQQCGGAGFQEWR
jgi:hypothetical protein